MAEMTPQQRQERARRAKMAMDEFFDPALAFVELDYTEKLIKVAASTDPNAEKAITRLANGIKVARQIRAQIDAIIKDGEVVEKDIERAVRKDAMTPAKRRLLDIGVN